MSDCKRQASAATAMAASCCLWRGKRGKDALVSAPSRENWLEAYKFLTPQAPAQLTEIARRDDPFLSLVGRTVYIRSIIARSDRSYEVSWIERTANGSGANDGEAYSGVFTVTTRPPRTADDIAVNLLGLLISDFSWSRVR